MSLLSLYRTIHRQAFLPIYVQDELDSRLLVDAAVEAGFACIEYTLRRGDAAEILPWIRRSYPDLKVIVGSTIDNNAIVHQQRQRGYPGLLTIDEVAALDVHGFVSMIGWTPETLARYRESHILMTAAGTVNEAFQQYSAGAHFVKLFGSDMPLVGRIRGPAAYDYCPILVTGGVIPERMPDVYSAGAALTASGFDLILRGIAGPPALAQIADALRHYQRAATAAQCATYPALAAAADADDATWLAALPHCHPFV